MFSSALVRRSALSSQIISKRSLSGGHESFESAKAEVSRWTKLTIVMVGISGLFGVYNIVSHSHDHPRTDLPYLKNRPKPFPWKCNDCNLFDYDCWNECKGKGKKAASHDAHH